MLPNFNFFHVPERNGVEKKGQAPLPISNISLGHSLRPNIFIWKFPHQPLRKNGVRNFCFSENLACFAFLLPTFWDSPSCYRQINEVIFMHVTNCNSLLCSEHEKFVAGSRLSPTIQVRYYSNFRKSTKTDEMNLELFQVMPNLNGNY